eukprot:TRINITY_DN730_c0_g1_i1.p2 TRINITY_DN730_c0_g1~~TRINITY_DN730_c0_g1_i1.p2  ORF type:complete len:128 (+),score=27.18 TRINITY_DN730_c0_g1_i1:166-549(+)
MCIRDRYQRRVRETTTTNMCTSDQPKPHSRHSTERTVPHCRSRHEPDLQHPKCAQSSVMSMACAVLLLTGLLELVWGVSGSPLWATYGLGGSIVGVGLVHLTVDVRGHGSSMVENLTQHIHDTYQIQ